MDKISNLIAQLTKTLENGASDNFDTKKSLIDDCVTDATKLLENDLIEDPNDNNTFLGKAQNDFKKRLAIGTEAFIQEMARIQENYNAKKMQKNKI